MLSAFGLSHWLNICISHWKTHMVHDKSKVLSIVLCSLKKRFTTRAEVLLLVYWQKQLVALPLLCAYTKTTKLKFALFEILLLL